MSFRSRSHTKPVAPPRRRSSSLTRNAGPSNGYSSSTPNSRPFSVHGSSMNFPSSSLYGSNQNLRSSTDYYGNGATDYRRSSYGTGLGTSNGASMKFPSAGSSYTSPYKDRYSSQNYYSPNGSNSYTSAYKDRGYYNPYTSYDNGVTTASLSFGGSSRPMRNSNLLTGSVSGGLGGSSTNLMGNGQSINDKVASIGRSQSLREHERKSRSRRCKEAVKAAVPDIGPHEASGVSSSLSSAQKSLSSLSLQSEGYEVNPMKSFSLLLSLMMQKQKIIFPSRCFSLEMNRALAPNRLPRMHLAMSITTVNSSTTKLSMRLLSKINPFCHLALRLMMMTFRRADNDRLRGSLKSREQDLAAAKSALERLTAAVSIPFFFRPNSNCQLVEKFHLLFAAIQPTSCDCHMMRNSRHKLRRNSLSLEDFSG
jgi:hypothetical protein